MTREINNLFEDDGYMVLRGFLPASILAEVKDEIRGIGEIICGHEFDFEDHKPGVVTPSLQSQLYDRLHYLPSLSRLSGSLEILAAARMAGISLPVLMGCCNMRYDRPLDEKHLFDWHQDTLYLLGSVNAVTVWIPFSRVDENRGTIQVIRGSHKKGIYPFKKISDKPVERHRQFLQRDLALDYDIQEEPVTIEAEAGDVVLFKQLLLHRSLPNKSSRVRWTAQVRISDLADDKYRKAGCPNGDKNNIFFARYPGFIHPQSQI